MACGGPSDATTVTRCVILAVLVVGFLGSASCRSKQPAAEDPSAAANEQEDDAVLDLQQRKYLWDIEHLAFVLEQKVFPAIAGDIAAGEHSKLQSCLAAGFEAYGLPERWETTYKDAQLEVRGAVAERDEGESAAEFLQLLHSFRERFRDDPSVSIGLVRLGPVDRNDFEGVWSGLWRIRLAGSDGQRPLELTFDLSVQLERLTDDLPERRGWIRSARLQGVRITQSQQVLMADVTEAWGIDNSKFHDNWRKSDPFRPNTGGVYLCDYNQDGLLDALIEDLRGAVLYQGQEQGGFRNVTQEAGLSALNEDPPAWVLSCWADLDGDGDEDLLSQNHIFENAGDGTFREVTDQSNLLLTPAAGYALADYDLDGRVDLYVCHTSAYRVGQRERVKVPWIDGGLGIDNVLWRNRGDWQFENVTAKTGTGGDGGSCFSAVWFDANGDRRPDLLTINEFGANLLLINGPEGAFTASNIDPVFGGFSMGLTSGDFDNDGHTDLYVSNMYSKAGSRILANVDPRRYPAALYPKLVEATQGNKLYRGRSNGAFDVVPADLHVPDIGWTYGSSFVDLNGDGYLDLYTTAGFKSEQRGKPDG